MLYVLAPGHLMELAEADWLQRWDREAFSREIVAVVSGLATPRIITFTHAVLPAFNARSRAG
ncbi:MAG: hypothetical protein ACE5FK_10795, partial [Candidatus Methylomirabilia bacterium]